MFLLDDMIFSDHLPLTLDALLDRPQDRLPHAASLDSNGRGSLMLAKWSNTLALFHACFYDQESAKNLLALCSSKATPNAPLTAFSECLRDLIASFKSPSLTPGRVSRRKGPPWFNKQCKQARNRQRSIYITHKESDSSSPPPAYFVAKKAYKLALFRAKQNWQQLRWKALLEATQSRNPRDFWCLLNRRPISRSIYSISTPTWELFLRQVFYDADLPFPTALGFFPEQLPRRPPVNPSTITKLIGQLKSGKAPGPDLIPAEAILAHKDWWITILTEVFNAINQTGIIPKVWKDAIIVPILKKGSPSNPGNFRNISLLSVLGKLYTRFLLSKLECWVE
uniref:Reverse transcriptase domain-containing protein n=2 Tax=Micrurus surinamensis TaxID=129470 RepID=A0A2D4PU68_MICSU